jgi:hypothetical protein
MTKKWSASSHLSFRHGRARPGHPDRKNAMPRMIVITGTRPMMTVELN